MRLSVTIWCLLINAVVLTYAQVMLGVNPTEIHLKYQADSLPLGSEAILVGVSGAEKAPFTAEFEPGTAECYVVSPSSGIAPQTVYLSINPNVLPYWRQLGKGCPAGVGFVPTSNPNGGGGVFIYLDETIPGPPVITSVVNAATLQTGVSPGALVTIYGQYLSTPPQTAQFDALGLYPTTLGNTTVTFNGVKAALLYLSPTQINAIAPYEIAGSSTVKISLSHNSYLVSIQEAASDTAPGIFTVGQTGSGQGAILNNPIPGAPGTVNSSSNPAPQGSLITIYATGSGVWNPAIGSGTLMLGPYHSNKVGDIYMPVAAVSLTIGGQPAKVTYAGPAPNMPAGVIQINAVVPSGIGSDPQPVVLTIGSNNNSQQAVTVAVQ